VGAKMIAVDTNIISLLLRGEEVDIPNDDLFIPYAVEAELRYGVAIGGNPEKYTKIIDDFLSQKGIYLSDGLNKEVLRQYVALRAYLKAQGEPISSNDIWIAAECTELDLPLLTRDQDFCHLPQVKLV
jgi:predicted nucleic acid-binding protein